MRRIILLIAILVSTAEIKLSAVEFPEEKFREGTEFYTAGKFDEALNVWLSIYHAGFRSSNLNYNIGNAYFKLNDIPHAILYYERALLLKPADEDINYNLQIARTYTVDKFAEIPELFFITWYNFVSLVLLSNEWAIISIASFVLFLILFAFYLFTSVYRFKITSFWISLLMIIISLASLSFSIHNKSLVYKNNKAIVVNPQVNGKSSPDNSGTDLFLIHEGVKVTITDALGNWYEIKLPDGNKGWVPSNCLEKL